MISIILFILLFSMSLCSVRPNLDVDPNNMVTVPTNCGPGQQWINGECRDIWRDFDPANVITVPTNCPEGQEYINGECRDIWMRYQNEFPANNYPANEIGPNNVVTVPTNCDEGQEWINGECRDIWRESNPANVIIVPPNCPPGQQYINGQCRDIWRSIQSSPDFQNSILLSSIIYAYNNNDVQREKRQVYNEDGETEQFGDLQHDPANRNIISVPNQCPSGYRPDALGICREIFD